MRLRAAVIGYCFLVAIAGVEVQGQALSDAQKAALTPQQKSMLGAAACITKQCRCALENGGRWAVSGKWIYGKRVAARYNECVNQ